MKIALIILGVLALIGVSIGGAMISANNSAVNYENQIVATYKDNENRLAQFGQSIQEQAQVTKIQSQDLKDLFTGALAARYGKDGSGAAMQWIQEQNPNLDQTTYQNLMTAIAGGRKDFENGQRKLIDVKRSYTTALGSFPGGNLMRWFGYPTIHVGFRGDTDDFPAITTKRANDAFQKGMEDGPLQIRN